MENTILMVFTKCWLSDPRSKIKVNLFILANDLDVKENMVEVSK